MSSSFERPPPPPPFNSSPPIPGTSYAKQIFIRSSERGKIFWALKKKKKKSQKSSLLTVPSASASASSHNRRTDFAFLFSGGTLKKEENLLLFPEPAIVKIPPNQRRNSSSSSRYKLGPADGEGKWRHSHTSRILHFSFSSFVKSLFYLLFLSPVLFVSLTIFDRSIFIHWGKRESCCPRLFFSDWFADHQIVGGRRSGNICHFAPSQQPSIPLLIPNLEMMNFFSSLSFKILIDSDSPKEGFQKCLF